MSIHEAGTAADERDEIGYADSTYAARCVCDKAFHALSEAGADPLAASGRH